MPGPTKLKDLLADAISDHGKATSKIFGRLGKGEKVDLMAETVQCLDRLTKTGAQFVLFWDNIATLMAADPGKPIDFPQPAPCAPGETATLTLKVPNVASAVAASGLRRRGEDQATIPKKAIQVTPGKDVVTVVVDCSGAARGLYLGKIGWTDSAGNKDKRVYNVYVNPA